MPDIATLGLRVDSSQIDKASKSLENMERQGGKTEKATDRMGVSFKAMSAATVATAAGITATTVALGKLAERGGQVLNVQRAFNTLTGDGASAINQLTIATKGLVTEYDLMVQMNRAVTLGSASTTAEFAELAETAITLGRALGVDAAFALESLSLGIGRQSKLILDNLGLIVGVEEANKKYAAALGIAAEALDDNQRREAFRTAALESARAKVAELGGVVLDAGDAWTQLVVELKNAKDEFALLLAQSPFVLKYFQGMVMTLRELRGESAAVQGTKLSLGGITDLKVLQDRYVDFLELLPRATRSIDENNDALKEAGLTQKDVGQILQFLDGRILALLESSRKLTTATETQVPTVDDILARYELMPQVIDEVAHSYANWTEKILATAAALGNLKPLTESDPRGGILNNAGGGSLGGFGDSLKGIFGGGAGSLAGLFSAITAIQSAIGLMSGLGGLVDSLLGFGEAAERAARAAELAEIAQRRMQERFEVWVSLSQSMTDRLQRAQVVTGVITEEILKSWERNRELKEAREAQGTDEGLLTDLVRRTHAEEDLADAIQASARAAEEAAAAFEQLQRSTEGLVARGLAVTGTSREQLLFSQATERRTFTGNLDFLGIVQGMELAQFDTAEALNELGRLAQEQDNALTQQIGIASDALSVAQEQLSAQEQTVSQTRQVVESLTAFSHSLLLGPNSPLSPAAQLSESRAQFETMAALALGGDVTAAQSLPGASKALLDASRGYNASGAGYVSDFMHVQAVVDSVTDRFGAQLTVEERILDELRTQTAGLESQIAILEAERQDAANRYNADVAALNAQWDAERARWAEQLQILQNQLVTLDVINLDAKEVKEKTLTLTSRTADSAAFQNIVTNTSNTTTVLQVGLDAVISRLGDVEDAIDGLGGTVRRVGEEQLA